MHDRWSQLSHVLRPLLPAAVVVLLLLLGPWNLWAALAVGAAVVVVIVAVDRRVRLHLRRRDRDSRLSLATEVVRAASDGNFASPAGVALARAAPHEAQAITAALERLRDSVDGANRLALNDPVTNLPNRLHVRREGEASLAALADDESAALLFIDLDRFKAVNDSLGHAHGDMLLMHVARRLRETVANHAANHTGRAPPLLGRLAGDEFTVLLPGSDRAEALALARQVLWAMRQPMSVGGRQVVVGASIGVAMAPADGQTLGLLMKAADDAMYSAKAQGRGQICLFENEMAERRLSAERLEAQLRGAIAASDLELAFQPQVQIATGRASVVEALLRWGPPGRSPTPAAEFMAVAEDTGLIAPLGGWVAGAVARRLGAWQRAGWSGRLSVNLSARELAQPGALGHLELSVAREGARLAGLEVEVSETTISRAPAEALEALSVLRSRGVTVTVDGFGNGWSRLVGLADLPVDRLKLDGALVRDLAGSATARTVAASAIGLIQGLGREAVAAGVETAEQLDIVTAMGVDAVQGWHIARPMDVQAMERWSYDDEASAAIAIAR